MNRKDGWIAVFDSGVGGISVLRELVKQMPNENFLYFGDSANAPYGSRSTEEIRKLTILAIERLYERGLKAVVIACNTATSAAINSLRELHPQDIIVGIEPAIKLAVKQFPRGKIAVMATEATLREQKFCDLKQSCNENCTIYSVPCPELVKFVERGETDSEALHQYLHNRLDTYGKLDAVVLGCTHFPFAKTAIQAVLGPQVTLLDGGEGTATQTKRRIEQANLQNPTGQGKIMLENSINTEQMQAFMQKMLHT